MNQISIRTLGLRAVATAAFFIPIASAIAQTPTPVVVVRNAKDLPAFAISFPKPEYPYELRSRRIGEKAFSCCTFVVMERSSQSKL